MKHILQNGNVILWRVSICLVRGVGVTTTGVASSVVWRVLCRDYSEIPVLPAHTNTDCIPWCATSYRRFIWQVIIIVQILYFNKLSLFTQCILLNRQRTHFLYLRKDITGLPQKPWKSIFSVVPENLENCDSFTRNNKNAEDCVIKPGK